MLDIKLIREKTDEVKQALLKRMDDVDFTELLQWDKEKKDLNYQIDNLRRERNQVSKQIPQLQKQGQDVEKVFQEMSTVSSKIKDLEKQLTIVEAKIKEYLETLPNIPAADVVAGGKENNQAIRVWGEKPQFAFQPKNHIDLVTSLGVIDYERGVKLGGSGFWLYKGDGALLEWALLNYFIEEHLKDGYEFILSPHILTSQCGYTSGQFPKFDEDVFYIKGSESKKHDLFLLPTAETALSNLHRKEILAEDDLPKRYVSYTPCYRKEAGTYRASERGMIRGHQFNKVEMFHYVRPEDSEAALEELIAKAEKLVKDLGLHYQVSKLAARDCSAAMAKTYDIEVWIPSMNEYKEVSSASNAFDYQARRGQIKFRRNDKKGTEFVHTLNGSGLATSRIFPAIMEQFQQEDGSVLVPKVLQDRVGKSVLKPINV